MARSIGCLVCCLVTLLAHQPALHRYESVEPCMGTLVKVTLYTSDEPSADKAFRAAFDRIGDLDRILSDYKPDSELNRVNDSWVCTLVRVTVAIPDIRVPSVTVKVKLSVPEYSVWGW